MRNAVTWVPRILLALLLAVAAWHLVLRLRLIPDARVDLGGAEINVIYGVQKVLMGRPLYEDPEQPPFDVIQYTPLHYGLLAGLARVFSLDYRDTHGLFILSRSVALALNLLTCLLVFALCRAVGCRPWPSIAVSALVFTVFTEHFYGRGDALYALLFVGALLAYARWQQRNGSRMLLMLTAMIAVLCVAAKQSGMLVIGIIGLDLLLQGAWRNAGRFALQVAVLMAIGALLIALNASGPFFLKNIVQGLANGISPAMYRELFDPPTYKYYVLFHLSIVLLILRAIRKGDRTDRFLATAAGASLAFGLITGLKSGSNLNYLFESHALAAIGVARWIGGASGVAGSFALLCALGFGTYRTRLLGHRSGTADEREAHAAALHADRAVHGELIGRLGLKPQEHVLVTYRGHLELLLNGKGLLAQKDVIAWSVGEVFDRSSFHRMMDEGAVRFVISDAPMDTLRYLGREWAPLQPVLEVEGRYVLALPSPGR